MMARVTSYKSDSDVTSPLVEVKGDALDLQGPGQIIHRFNRRFE